MSISVTLHDFMPDPSGEDHCAFVYTLGYGNPDRRCNVEADGHKRRPEPVEVVGRVHRLPDADASAPRGFGNVPPAARPEPHRD